MRPEALSAMVDALQRVPGNPSGQHRWARDARRLLDDARDQIAQVVGCEPGEVVFTSGGTEADNLAIAGSVQAHGGVASALCVATDHHAVLDPVAAVGGVALPVERSGTLHPDVLAAALAEGAAERPMPAVVSMALANNELGVEQPLAELAAVVREHAPDASVHVDAVAAAAWLDLAEVARDADLISLSGHKVGGPKGIGALIVRRGTPLHPVQLGGGQERERRGGTQNVAGAVAFAAALSATASGRADTVARVGALRDRLVAALLAASPQIVETVPAASGVARVANIAHLCLRGVHREALLFRLDEQGVAASAGSSCASGALEPSHVAVALDLPSDLRQGTLRLSLGWTTTEAEVDRAIAVVSRAVVDLQGTGTASSPASAGAAGSVAT